MGVGAAQLPKFDGLIPWSVFDGSSRLSQSITTGRPVRKTHNLLLSMRQLPNIYMVSL